MFDRVEFDGHQAIKLDDDSLHELYGAKITVQQFLRLLDSSMLNGTQNMILDGLLSSLRLRGLISSGEDVLYISPDGSGNPKAIFVCLADAVPPDGQYQVVSDELTRWDELDFGELGEVDL